MSKKMINLSLPVLCSLFLLFIFSAAQARDLVPTPPGGGQGISTLTEDTNIPFNENNSPDWVQARANQMQQDFLKSSSGQKSEGTSDIGGYDKLVDHFNDFKQSDLAVAQNGDIYMAAEYWTASYGYGIRVYRSTDDGNSFTLWGWLSNASVGESYSAPSIVVAEGIEDRIYLAYTRTTANEDPTIRMVHSELAGNYASFSSEVVVIAENGTTFDNANLATDAASFNSYYMYVVAEGQQPGSGVDIYYARSTNQAVSFEDSYAIATLSNPDRGYFLPEVSWGYGGIVHTAWHFSVDGHDDDDAVRYRQIESDGGGGLDNWEPILALTSRTNGMSERDVSIAASIHSHEVMLVSERREWYEDSYYLTHGAGVLISRDSGDAWGSMEFPNSSLFTIMDLIYKSQTEEFIMCGSNFYGAAIQRTSRHDPLDWNASENFADRNYSTGYIYDFGFAISQSHDQQVCTVWPESSPTMNPDYFYFDAEWKGAPGNPNIMDEFPIDIPYSPRSAPAVVDLDNDGDLEVIYTDFGNWIQVFNHDGSAVDGWPVHVPDTLSNSPVAIGDLNGNGNKTVVVGTMGGEIFAYDSNGYLQSGFPHQMPFSDSVFVSIGALGDGAQRTIVGGCNNSIHFVNNQGETPANVVNYAIPGQIISHPIAIGDVDGDGISEVVIPGTNKVLVKKMSASSSLWYLSMGADISNAPTLADLDLDGDVEVLIPLANGTLQVKDASGSNFPGFPVSMSSGLPLSSASLAQIRGTVEPDIIVADSNSNVDGFFPNGNRFGGFPITTIAGGIHNRMPVINNIDNLYGGEVVMGSGDNNIWAWSNFGIEKPGWPRELEGSLRVSPAVGDLDANGTNETIFIAGLKLFVFDTQGNPLTGNMIWPMQGYDAQRTGCLDCPEDLLSPVDPGGSNLVTRVRFAAPSPNPTNGPTLFSFDLPVRSAVRLDVYDIRGHKVHSLVKEEMVEGSHTINWNGRDSRGRSLASGVYFANLSVRGPGLNQDLSRKLNLLR